MSLSEIFSIFENSVPYALPIPSASQNSFPVMCCSASEYLMICRWSSAVQPFRDDPSIAILILLMASEAFLILLIASVAFTVDSFCVLRGGARPAMAFLILLMASVAFTVDSFCVLRGGARAAM